MKKFSLLLGVALIWGCQDRVVSPTDNGWKSIEEYGSSVISVPGLTGLPGAAKLATGVVYKFQLTITGPGMQTMTFGFPLGRSDTAITLNQIPAGASRLFTGTVYGPQGVMYEGSAATTIVPGKTAYVKLLLRSTGAAQVNVVIEGVNDDTLGGCFKLDGRFDTTILEGYTVQISSQQGSQFWAYVSRGDKMVGKFWGTLNAGNLNGEISLPDLPGGAATIRGGYTQNFTEFKGELFSVNDSLQRRGTIYGRSIPCQKDTIVPPASACFTDTMSTPSGKCMDADSLLLFASAQCKKNGLTLGKYTLSKPCDSTSRFVNYICFECCSVTKK